MPMLRKPTRKRRPYQFSLVEALSIVTVIAASLGLLRWGQLSGNGLIVAGGVVLGGASLGAVIGRAFEDERGGVTWMGAYLGAIVPIVLAFLVPFILLAVLAVKRALW